MPSPIRTPLPNPYQNRVSAALIPSIPDSLAEKNHKDTKKKKKFSVPCTSTKDKDQITSVGKDRSDRAEGL